MLEKTEGAIKNEQSRELVTLGTQDTGQRQTKHRKQKKIRNKKSSHNTFGILSLIFVAVIVSKATMISTMFDFNLMTRSINC